MSNNINVAFTAEIVFETIPQIVFTCPVCGSQQIIEEHYNTLNITARSGSAGILRKCAECGYSYNYINVQF